MKFFRKTEFCDYLYVHFGLEQGFIQLMKAEEVGDEEDAYLFTYGHPYTRVGKNDI